MIGQTVDQSKFFLAGGTNNVDVILRCKVIYLSLYNTRFHNKNVFIFVKEIAQTKKLSIKIVCD